MSKGRVLWFNKDKCFGFIKPDGDEKDIFVHMQDVKKAGLTTLLEGQHIEYEVAHEGLRAHAMNLRLLDVTEDCVSLEKSDTRLVGTVSWLDEKKGFGFIKPDGDGRDVFVHISAAKLAGLETLMPGQRVKYNVVPDRRRGKVHAVDLELAQA